MRRGGGWVAFPVPPPVPSGGSGSHRRRTQAQADRQTCLLGVTWWRRLGGGGGEERRGEGPGPALRHDPAALPARGAGAVRGQRPQPRTRCCFTLGRGQAASGAAFPRQSKAGRQRGRKTFQKGWEGKNRALLWVVCPPALAGEAARGRGLCAAPSCRARAPRERHRAGQGRERQRERTAQPCPGAPGVWHPPPGSSLCPRCVQKWSFLKGLSPPPLKFIMVELRAAHGGWKKLQFF